MLRVITQYVSEQLKAIQYSSGLYGFWGVFVFGCNTSSQLDKSKTSSRMKLFKEGINFVEVVE